MGRTGQRWRWAAWSIAIAVALVATLLGAACRRGVPVVDPGPRPPTQDGTISGRLMTPGDASRLSGRRVEVVNIQNGDSRSVSTASDGGFTVKVPPGKYRLKIELHPGEAIVRGPDTIDINPSDLDSDIVIEITAAPPRLRPVDNTRGSEGLGAPVA